MIRPPRGFWSFMILNASCVQKNEPVRLVSTTAFHCATVRSSRSPAAPMPALLNRRSSRPNALLVCAKSERMAWGSHTSVGTTSALERASPASADTVSRASLRRPASETWYPSRSSASPTALPTPLPAPVTIATFLSMSVILLMAVLVDAARQPTTDAASFAGPRNPVDASGLPRHDGAPEGPMGRIVYAAAMSHVLYPDYYGENV